jgi:DnaJ-class molecular chaperone
MPTDPYTTLGLKRDATQAQIKSAYLKLAKKHHPDLNPGDKKSEELFKNISAANDLLSDPEKRRQFDAGEIDATGQQQGPRPGYRGFADGAQGGRYHPGAGASPFGGTGPDGLHDIFADLFANARGGGGGFQAKDQPMRGQDQRYQLSVSFIEAALGAARRLTLPDGRTLDVTIPPGLETGQTLRLRGQGAAGWNGAPPGDALIEVEVTDHPYYERVGDDIHLELPVTAAEAANGAKVAVPTPAGPVTMSIPRHSDTGKQLRLRGRGIPARGTKPAGDLYVILKVVLGGPPDEALEKALAAYYERHPVDPRAQMGGGA